MKKFIEKNFVIIVMIITILVFFRGCSDSRNINRLQNDVQTLTEKYNVMVEQMVLMDRIFVNNERSRTLDATVSALSGIKDEAEKTLLIKDKTSLIEENKYLRSQLKTLQMIINKDRN